MNNINNSFKLQIDGIIEALSSKGTKFLQPREYNSEDLANLEWVIKLEDPEPLLHPTKSQLYKDKKGNLNIVEDRWLARMG